MEHIDIFDDDETPAFSRQEWIGKGRKFPASFDVPPELQAYINSALDIPQNDEKSLLPDVKLSVHELLSMPIQRRDYNLVNADPTSIFEIHPPNINPSCLRERTIPSQRFVKDVRDAIGQALLDGASSVRDPRYKGGRLPIWTITFWTKMHSVFKARDAWEASHHWLRTHYSIATDVTQDALSLAQAHLHSLSWGSATLVPGAGSYITTADFALLLADGMISTSIMDMMMKWIAERIRTNGGLSERYEVVGLEFWNEIEKATRPDYFSMTASRRFLHKLENELRAKGKILFFPVFLPEKKHFVIMKADHQKRMLAYGDGLEHCGFELPKRVMQKIQWWLCERFAGKYEWLGCSVKHGKQTDWVSCGIGAANMVSHETLGDPLWHESRSTLERVTWFNRIAKSHARLENSISSSTINPITTPALRTTSLHGVTDPTKSTPQAQSSSSVQQEKSANANLSGNRYLSRAWSPYDEDPFSGIELDEEDGPLTALDEGNTDEPFPSDTEMSLSSRPPSQLSSCDDGESSSVLENDAVLYHKEGTSSPHLIPYPRADSIPRYLDVDESIPDTHSSMPDTYSEPSIPDTHSSMSGTRSSMPDTCLSMLDTRSSIPVDLQEAVGPVRGILINTISEAVLDGELSGRHAKIMPYSFGAEEGEGSVTGCVIDVIRPHPSNNEEAVASSKPSKGTYSIFTETQSRVEAVRRQREEAQLKEKTKKRQLDDVDTSIDMSSHTTDAHKRPRVSLLATHGKQIGTSRSNLRTHRLKEAVIHGSYVPSQTQLAKFKKTILELDPLAEFPDHTGSSVRHFVCGKVLKMREACNTVQFSIHVNGGPKQRPCQGLAKTKLSGGGSSTLDGWFGPRAVHRTAKAMVDRPCAGLQASYYPKVARYLERSPAPGGGGPSLTTLTEHLYPSATSFASLSSEKKETVRATQRLQHKWHNHRDLQRVISASCSKFVTVPKDASSAPVCQDCLGLLGDKNFKVAVSLPVPDAENFKFTPKIAMLSDEQAAERWSRATGLKPLIEAYKKNPAEPCLVFVKGVLQGDFASERVFLGLMEALVQKKDKELRGVGMQGFKYAPDVVEMAHIINIHSPRAYQAIRNAFPFPEKRTLQLHQAREMRFPVGIEERVFDLARDQVHKLNWTGPLAVGCDDTKTLPSLNVYQDKTGKYYLVGSTSPKPMLIANPDQLTSLIRKGLVEKATKLRLWCLQVPMPSVPTIILAAMAISNKMSAEELFPYLQSILLGLLSRGLQVVSYAADGAATERALQRLVTTSAAEFKLYTIPHPENPQRDIELRIPLFGPQRQPIAMVQDLNHLAKTLRNNEYSGARALTLGDHTVLYSHCRTIAFEGGPLFHRDVEKLDRQDDNAATRLFSGHTLNWLTENHPEWTGTIVYLFVFGELIDAFKNRSMAIIDRVYLALRAVFFMEAWEDFLDQANYPKSKHFLSHEACNIIHILTHGLLQLVFIYRDHFDRKYPLLPWLHSTEICEHVFGICRQIIKDFTVLDFQYMVPKLFVRLREHFFFAHKSDGKARASGYNHTYTDSRDIDLIALATYPSDLDIQNAARAAYDEAHGLWETLGVDLRKFDEQQSSSRRFPSIGSCPNFLESDVISDSDANSDADYEACVGDDGMDFDDDLDDEESEAFKIQRVMEYLEDEVTNNTEDEHLNGLAFAAVALSVQDSMSICQKNQRVSIRKNSRG
ncbi:hypothetical protein EW146_g9969 [Bondarzewia mesenterica]|uniref:Ubiquitin-like protease family profile domain-containing protein n=1 Tax=Bondarzewia mesenterica TaxID=1095465 RepID=A0A4S4L1T9_9AGAM|nr:hypothetical protein EW146_g9969 [Bondarzewia mesenterica]